MARLMVTAVGNSSCQAPSRLRSCLSSGSVSRAAAIVRQGSGSPSHTSAERTQSDHSSNERIEIGLLWPAGDVVCAQDGERGDDEFGAAFCGLFERAEIEFTQFSPLAFRVECGAQDPADDVADKD